MRSWLAPSVLALSLAACGGASRGVPDGALDGPGGSLPDGGPADTTPAAVGWDGGPADTTPAYVGWDGSAEAGACAFPLTGDTPFGAVVGADVDFSAPDAGIAQTVHIRLEVYFPQGRVPGAPVILSRPVQWPEPGVATGTGQLGSGGGAQVTWCGRYDQRDLVVTASLGAPDEGLDAVLDMSFTDATPPDTVRATARLCPEGPLPAPRLATADFFGPITAVTLAPTAPLDPATVTVTATVGGSPVATKVAVYTSIQVGAVPAFPPGQAVTFDVSGTKDILGRAFALTAQPAPLATTAADADLGFDAAPPQGSLTAFPTSRWSVAGGSLQVTLDLGDVSLLLALPDPGAASRLRVTASWDLCHPSLLMAVVDAVGHATWQGVPLGSPIPADLTLELPSERPLWFALAAQSWAPGLIDPPLPACLLTIDALAFE
jgi:hypothetical protein